MAKRILPEWQISVINKCIPTVTRWEGVLDGNPKTASLDPYLCPANYWTIGYGHVVKDAAGRMIKGKENKDKAYAVYPNGITKAEAVELLWNDLAAFSNFVRRVAKGATSHYQLAALTSFAFNLGNGNLGKSSLLRNLNAGADEITMINSFLQFIRADGKILNGLITRRVDEAMLFYTGKLTKKEVYVLAKQILQVQRSMNLDILNAKTPLL